MHFALRHFVAQHPHAERIRKRRDRKLTAIRPAMKNRLWYASTLQTHVISRLREAGKAAVQELRPHWPLTTDHDIPSVRFVVTKARNSFPDVSAFAGHVATQAARKNLETVDDRLAASIHSSLGVDVRQNLMEHGPILGEMHRMARENVELITSIPEMYFEDLEQRLSEGWTSGERWESMAGDIAEIGDVAARRAEFIARDQTNKANSAFNRVRQTSLGIDRAEWQTAGDGLVRESHVEMEGVVFEWEDPPDVDGEPLLPGDDYNCRCVGAPVVDLDEDEQPEIDVGEVDPDDLDFEESDMAAE